MGIDMICIVGALVGMHSIEMPRNIDSLFVLGAASIGRAWVKVIFVLAVALGFVVGSAGPAPSTLLIIVTANGSGAATMEDISADCPPRVAEMECYLTPLRRSLDIDIHSQGHHASPILHVRRQKWYAIWH